MFQECRFILTSGYKCKSPALRGQQFCYFHAAARHYASIRTSSADPLLFPSIEDAAGVQIALNQVIRQFGAHRLDRKHAGVFFYGLQIAARLARKSDQKPTETVREICEQPSDGYGEGCILAPEKATCEPPGDCVNCRRRDFCQDFEFWETDVEELEERLAAQREAEEELDREDQ